MPAHSPIGLTIQFIGLHEWDVQCQSANFIKIKGTESSAGVGEANWEFKTSFPVTHSDLSVSQADLVFEGLDTFASVVLVRIPLRILPLLALIQFQNGKEILKFVLSFLG